MRNPYIFRVCYVLALLFCLLNTHVSAQSDPPIISQFASGNADAMTIFGQYPQISYTGVPAISIPIYNFSYEGLSLPVKLSYNNNLVKPYDIGSWVGLGWNMTAGGVINRTVNGKPDDCNWYGRWDLHYSSDYQMGYYYNYGYLSAANWTDDERLKNTNGINVALGGSNGVRDYTPDTFTFSIGDLSGSFYLDDHRNWQVKSRNKVKVVIDDNNDFNQLTDPSPTVNDHTYLVRIKLIDNRGISYVFGGTNDAYEEVKSDPADSTDIFVKSWYIKTITFPNGKQITFDYTKGPQIDFSQPAYFNSDSITTITQKNHPVYLSAIHSDLVDISFITSQRATHYSELDTIKINNKNSLYPVKQFAFSYVSTKTNSFKLTDVTQLDKNNHAGAHYGFGYDAESFDSLRVHPNTDHWGYYNTKAANAHYDGTGTTRSFNWTDYIYSRSRDTAHCRAELLERITYPTGGYTTYTWEPNQANYFIDYTDSLRLYSDSASYADIKPGGVRIRQITNYDQTNIRLSSKKYLYVNNFSPTGANDVSSGIVQMLPKKRDIPSNGPTFGLFPLTYVLDLESHISYSQVAEVNNDGSYTITKYSNSDNGYNNAPYENYFHRNPPAIQHGISYPSYSSNVQERGAPLNIRTYLSSGTLLSEKSYQYTTVLNNDYVKAYVMVIENPAESYFRCSAVKIFTNNFLPAIVTETLYNNTVNPVIKTTTYAYDDSTANLTKVQVLVNSRRQTEETDYVYPDDLAIPGHDPSGVYEAMKFANYTSPLIETVKKINGTQLSLSRTDYKTYTTAGSQTVFVPDSSTMQYGTSTVRTTDKYSGYDDYGHLATELNNGIVPTTYIYSYNNNLITAKIINATKDEIMYEDFESPSANNAVKYGAAHSGVQYYLGGYSPSFQVPDTRPYVVSFWYHTSGGAWKYKEEPYMRYSNLLPAGANALDDICIYPADAQLTTYGYNPLAGLTSQTDTKGNTTYYEYDDLQRLVNIKDKYGNIKTHYCYNYAGQETDCTVSFISAPPAVPVANGVYARLEITNLRSMVGETETDIAGDANIKFYADPAATIPLTLTSDVQYTIDTFVQEKYDGDIIDTQTFPDYATHTVPAGNNTYYLGLMYVDDLFETTDGYGNIHYSDITSNYNLISDSTFTALPTLQ